MTEQEKLAREWAEKIKKKARRSPSWFDDECLAAADLVLANTKPPTMADVQWDAREHLGTIGVGEDGVEWVMLGRRPDGSIVGITADFQKLRELRPKWLTPNGKRCELREVGGDQPEHTKWLRNEEDFKNAPSGTIVTRVSQLPMTKFCDEWRGLFGNETPTSMAGLGLWEVLRWGWNG